jgi:probable FeS assembly SUF system protein SufT
MTSDDWAVLSRDCPAVAIPGGYALVLSKGSRVRVRQALGRRFIVATSLGMLARIDGGDADALGLPRGTEDVQPVPASSAAADPLEQRVWAELRSCFDPEIPVNIVELGLIYGLSVVRLASGDCDLSVDLTLTAPGCGMGETLKQEIERKLARLHGVHSATVRLVFDPPWDRSRMSEAARLQLGL